MSTATDKELAQLHSQVAKAMSRALENSSLASALLSEFGEDLPEKVKDFLSRAEEVNPALLQAITKFLRDNDITCSVEDNAEMSELQKSLQAKRERRASVGNVTHIHTDE